MLLPMLHLKRCMSYAFAAFLACNLAGDAVAGKDEATVNQSEWTIMVFMDSDNNLEEPQMENILAMAKVGPPPGVRIIMLVDRSTQSDEDGYTNRDVLNLKSWTGGKIFEVQKGSLKPIADLGDINMGDPAELTKFVARAADLAPAKKYGLIFGDHGGSWTGFDSDGSHDDDGITLTELDSALKDITGKLGRLELIHYDDCLMSCVENATAVAPYSKWLTASAEVVPGDGCDYEGIMKAFAANPAIDGKELGSIIVSTFNDFYRKATAEHRKDAAAGITMALIDCDQVEPLTDALAKLRAAATEDLKQGGRQAFLKAARARADATEYGRGSGDEPNTGVVDIVDFCRLIQREYGSGPVSQAAEHVVQCLLKAVVKQIHGTGLPGARGMSLYLPQDDSELQGEGNKYTHTQFSAKTGWDQFIATYLGVRVKDHTDPTVKEVAAPETVLKPSQEITLSSKVDGDDLDEIYFVLAIPDGKNKIIMGQVPTDPDAKGDLSESWNGNWFHIDNGKESMICPIDEIQLLDETKPDGEMIATVPVQLRRGGKGEWIDLTLTFLLDFSDDEAVTGDLVYAFEDGAAGPREVEIKKGDIVRPVFLVIDDKGEEDYAAAEGPENELKVTEDGLGISEERVDKGDYLVGFRAIDLSGNASEQLIKVRVAGG